MTNIPHLIEAALLLLVAYLIGCLIGYFLRANVFKKSGAPAAAPASAMAKPAPARTTAKAAPAKAPPAKAAPAAAKKKTATKPTAKPSNAKQPATKTAPKVAAASVNAAPKKLEAPRNGQKENLKIIKGIGPKIEGQLNALGVYHFDQIGAWDRGTVAWVDSHLSFKGRIDREEWVSQAKVLAKSAK